MIANNKLGLATFYDHVQVINFPTDDPETKILDNKAYPPGYMLILCDKMEVLKQKLPNGSNTQEMRAYRKVYVESEMYQAQCDVLKYDASKEQVIFEGSEGSPAVLYKEAAHARERDTIRAKKIFYNRVTGECKTEGTEKFNMTK